MSRSLNINYKVKESEIPPINWNDVSTRDLYEYMDKRVFEGAYPWYFRGGSIYPKDVGFILKDPNTKEDIFNLMNNGMESSLKQKLDSKMKRVCLNSKLDLVSIENIQENIQDENKFVFVEEGLRNWELEFKNGVYVSIDRSKKDVSYFLEYYKLVEDCCQKDLSILDKSWVVIGGGAIGDVLALVSSIFKVNYTLIPTTLSSMISSSISGWGKVNVLGVDEKRIGEFYPASEILVCRNFLETLDICYLYEGLLEGIKLAIISKDKSIIEEILEFIKDYEKKREESKFINISDNLLEKLIKIKVSFIEKDPLGKENIPLGLGNTLASILNKINYSNIGRLSTGESLAVGLMWSFFVSNKLGYLSNNNYSYYTNVLKRSNSLLDYTKLCLKMDISNKKEEGLDVCSDDGEEIEYQDKIFSSMINEMILHERLKNDYKEDKIGMILLTDEECRKEYLDIEIIEKYWNEFFGNFRSIIN